MASPPGRERLRFVPGWNVPVLYGPDHRPVCFQLPTWLDRRSQRDFLDLVHAVGCGLCVARERRSPLRHFLQRGERKDPLHLHCDYGRHHHRGADGSAAGRLRLRFVSESRAVCVSRHQAALSLLDLRRLLGGGNRSLCGAGLFRAARPCAADSDRRRVRTMSGLLSAFSICIFAILRLGSLVLPIGYSLIVGSIIYLFMRGLDLGTSAEQILNGLYNSYVLLAVPLFLVSAELMNVSKMTDHLLRFCDMLVGRFKGGLGHINIAQSIIFAGMSGSAIADLAGTGRISIDMMTRNNRYTLSYAAAITAASAVIGPIIPPSIPMVLYALVSDVSVGYLFIGGVIPGLLMALAQMVINTLQAHRHNFPVERPIPLREWPYITWIATPALLMPVILLGGIYSGVVTPTEAAAVAAAYAFLVAAVWYRNISVRDTYDAVLNSARSTASIGLLISGALVFNYVVTVEQIPETVKGLLAGYDLSPNMFLLWVNIILLVLGCLLEGSTIILVILPIFIPTAKALGVDLVHFGVMAVFNIMIGLITPPYGLLLFIISAISGAPLRLIIRDTLPFVYAMIVALLIITYFPELVLWLPRQMGYKG